MRVQDAARGDSAFEVLGRIVYAPVAMAIAIGDAISSAANGIHDFVLPENPVHGRREFHFLPQWFEISLGTTNYQSTIREEGGISENRELAERIRGIFNRLLPHVHRREFAYECNVLKANTVNAWAMPGGKIAIYEGLINKIRELRLEGFDDVNEDDVIAAVLGHELAHTDIGHTRTSLERTFIFQALNFVAGVGAQVWCATAIAKEVAILENPESSEAEKNAARKTKSFYESIQVVAFFVSGIFSKIGVTLMNLARSRTHEFEADKYGIHYMHRAGFNTRGALFLQKLFEREHPRAHWLDFLSTHPAPSDRYEANLATIRELEPR